jgi:hypothetical protein
MTYIHFVKYMYTVRVGDFAGMLSEHSINHEVTEPRWAPAGALSRPSVMLLLRFGQRRAIDAANQKQQDDQSAHNFLPMRSALLFAVLDRAPCSPGNG